MCAGQPEHQDRPRDGDLCASRPRPVGHPALSDGLVFGLTPRLREPQSIPQSRSVQYKLGVGGHFRLKSIAAEFDAQIAQVSARRRRPSDCVDGPAPVAGSARVPGLARIDLSDLWLGPRAARGGRHSPQLGRRVRHGRDGVAEDP